jgi:hypothetical protein
MTAACTTKYIEEFCSRYLSLSLNFSLQSSPTIEITLLGKQEPTALQITSDLKSVGIPIINEADWIIASTSYNRSSSGITTSIRLIDSIWAHFQSYYITAGPFDGYWDAMIGQEYFNIAGVPFMDFDGRQKNVLVTAPFLRAYYNFLNTGYGYITADGAVVSKPSTVSQEDFIKNFAPGLPNPYVEFGEYFYKSSELFNGHFGDGTSTSITNVAPIRGLFNESGTAYSVLSSIGAKFGKMFIANSIWGTGYIDLYSDYGKISVLNNAGITIPEEAVESSESKDYSSGYSANFKRVTRTPGRYHRDQGSTGTTIINNNNYEASPQGVFYSGRVGLDTEIDLTDEYEEDELVWSMIKDHPIIDELGAAIAILDAEPLTDKVAKYYEDQLSGGRDWYKGVEAKLANADFKELVKNQLFLNKESENTIDAQITAWENTSRFWYTKRADTEAGGYKEISLQGQSDDDFYPQSFGFENFGTAQRPLGTKSWTLSGTGSLFFCPWNASKRDFGFASAGTQDTMEDVLGVDEDRGAIVVDYGALPFPSNIEEDVSIGADHNFIDISRSVLDENKAAFGGVAGIKYQSLKDKVDRLCDSVKNQIQIQGAKRASRRTYAFWSGIKDPTLIFTGGKQALDGDGNRLNGSKRTVEQQENTINERASVFRKMKIHECGPDIPEGASKVNRHVFHDVTTMAWHLDTLYNSNENVVKTIELAQNGVPMVTNWPFISNAECLDTIEVPFIESLEFSLINTFYEMNEEKYKYLESLNINIVDGKVTSKYSFSQKSSTPNLKQLNSSGVRLKNLIK